MSPELYTETGTGEVVRHDPLAYASPAETPPEARTHEMYFGSDEWTVADVEDIDRLFVCDQEDGTIRIDLDGRAAPSAEIADKGDRVNLSIWLTTEQRAQLVDALEEADR